jgi:hypothetical protein
VSLSPPPPEVSTVFKALESGCVDSMYEDQIQTFVLEALECTAAFKAVQATASLLNQYTSESMQTEVDYCTGEAQLHGYYRIALPKVLQFLKSHEFAAMNVPNALDWIQKWDAWSELLDYVRWVFEVQQQVERILLTRPPNRQLQSYMGAAGDWMFQWIRFHAQRYSVLFVTS